MTDHKETIKSYKDYYNQAIDDFSEAIVKEMLYWDVDLRYVVTLLKKKHKK